MLGLEQLIYVYQLAYECDSFGSTILAGVEIVDDALTAGNKKVIADLTTGVQRQYKLVTAVDGPGCFLY